MLKAQKGLKSHRNLTLKMFSLRVMVERSREKKKQEETEKQQHVIATENYLFKGFSTESVRNYD